MFQILLILITGNLTVLPGQVAEMKWELDYQIYLEMANDSNYTYDISQVFHITDARNIDYTTEFVFYPVNPGNAYQENLPESSHQTGSVKTLWGALHDKLGGGWIHFANCMAYAVETRTLDLQEPIMERPDTRWKPDPVTDTWKITRKWDYYLPVSQKNAIREYKRRRDAGQLGDLENLPQSYIHEFLATSEREYARFSETGNFSKKARIDLVKIILGANYLGEAQISYISSAVLNAVNTYSASKLPSVLIFDEFDAAAAMSLDAEGYRVESIVFRESAGLSPEEMHSRQEEIQSIIKTINEYNRAAFQKRLDSYYKRS